MTTDQFVKQMAQYKVKVTDFKISTRMDRDGLMAGLNSKAWSCRATHYRKRARMGQSLAFQLGMEPDNNFIYDMALLSILRYFMGQPKKWVRKR